ncbi:MAG TPA: hypothetical protein VKT81_20655 [Bryobacteraceae bacterium]|nr:hypothetical protein [Bryobacteraceae bacterium]
MKSTKRNRFLMAAVAGIAMGASAPAPLRGQDTDEVQCYGINSCHAQAKCGLEKTDIEAVRALLGDQEFKARFGKSRTHSCGAHSSCGAQEKILNWVQTSGAACKAQDGILIEDNGGKKVAKKA